MVSQGLILVVVLLIAVAAACIYLWWLIHKPEEGVTPEARKWSGRI